MNTSDSPAIDKTFDLWYERQDVFSLLKLINNFNQQVWNFLMLSLKKKLYTGSRY